MARSLRDVERDLNAMIKRQRQAKAQLREVLGETYELMSLTDSLDDAILDLVKERAQLTNAPYRVDR